MGYSYEKHTNGTNTNYWPDDSSHIMYIHDDGLVTMQDILSKIGDKWPQALFEHISVEAREIQTRCLGYDLYDSFDYDEFIILELKEQ